jgi:hypothetical protein
VALWNGSSLNNNVLAQVFNQLFNTKAIEIVRKENGLLYAILGKSWQDANSPTGVSFERLERISGNQIEVKLLGALDTITTVADGAAELATSSPAFTNNMFGSVTFDLTHYAQTKGIPSSEYNRIQGKEAKTLKYVDDVFNQVMLSIENTIGNGINATASNGPSRTVLGNWPQAVSDGVSSGETAYAVYGLDRSDNANVDFRGSVGVSTGDLTLGKIRSLKNTIRTKGGKNQLGIAETSVFTKLQLLVEAYTEIESSQDWSQFGGEYVQYGKTRYILDQRAPTQQMAIIDPESWVFYQNMINFTDAGFARAPHLVAGYVLPWECYCQLICLQPSRNGKLTGINS